MPVWIKIGVSQGDDIQPKHYALFKNGLGTIFEARDDSVLDTIKTTKTRVFFSKKTVIIFLSRSELKCKDWTHEGKV